MSIPGAAGRSRRSRRVWLGIALLVIGLNLRPAVVAVSPLLNSIEATTGLSPAAAGVLTALPVLCFGAFASFAPRIVQRAGPEATMLGVLLLLAGAFAVRLPGTVWALFLGAFLAGAAIAIGNVLLPGIIKRDFPDKAGLMTTLYTMMLIGGGAVTAGLTVPIEHAASFSWRAALAMWGVLAVVAIVCWGPQLRSGHRNEPGAPGRTRRVRGLWREALAWQVTLFYGLQSLDYYATFSWLPGFFSAHGMSAGQAGWMLSFSSICGLFASLGTPFVVKRWRIPGWLAVTGCTLCAACLIGLIAAPLGGAYAWMLLLGLGQGTIADLAITFIVMRSPDTRHAAELSSMAQSGYLLAAAGPLVFGVLRDVTGGWTVPLVVTAALTVPEAVCGLLAGRDLLVGRHEREHPDAARISVNQSA